MNLQNIASVGREIYLFSRINNKLNITKDSNYYPYYYEKDSEGLFLSYDDVLVSKVIAQNPRDIRNLRSDDSYSNDIRYELNYITDKIPTFTKGTYKYLFIDIEVLAKEMPDANNPKDPVSCISVYDSETQHILSFYLEDYKTESSLLEAFVDFIKKSQPDLILAWNVEFDYKYLHNRIKNFAKAISPINVSRSSPYDDIFYPCGISVLDYLTLFKKVHLRENSYRLDSVAEKHLGFGKQNKEVDFGTLSRKIVDRNREDVELLVKLEEKFHILDYFNEIRVFSKCQWEELTHNSMILDALFIQEAKNRDVVLPNSNKVEDMDDDEELEGAYRRAETGVFTNVYKADVASMYPSQLVNFCLDTTNITNDVENVVTVENIPFRQDPSALLPSITTRLMSIKDSLKKELKQAKENSEEKKLLQIKYDAYKGLVNSIYGVTAQKRFRLYDYRVASSITFLARDLLKFVEEEMQSRGHKVIYTDTDALMYEADSDKIDLLNELVQTWGKKYNKEKLNIIFESEGKFENILILGKCHYLGYIIKKGTLVREVKGIEMKRSSSSKFEAKFQEALIDKVLKKVNNIDIEKWIETERKNISQNDLTDVAYPCKIAVKKYKNIPIFMRAYENTKLFDSSFQVGKGENFYYIFMRSLGKDKNGKDIDVIAFTNETAHTIDKDRINWDEVIQRSINNKADKIFTAIKYQPVDQVVLF